MNFLTGVPKLSLIAQTVRSRLPFPTDAVQLVPLAGDASNRRYYRVQLQSGPLQSLIVMQLAAPEAFKESEEAVSGAPAITELPFINVGRHLAEAEVPVPILYHYDRAAGLLYLEDFGDCTLTQAWQSCSASEIRHLYATALDILVRMQTRASRGTAGDCLAFSRAFDVPLLMWEFDHFLEYGVVARRGEPMAPSDEKQIRGEFYKIAETLAEQPRVFTHRDYHSRNLMIREGHRLGVLDFQDALLGPATYDLASLLRDAYVALEDDLLDELIADYLERMAAYGVSWPDRAAFRRLFDLTSIQRNLKAAGRFVYIDRVKRNPSFLCDIPRTLGYVRRNLAKYPELATLCKHLTPYVPELQ